MQQSLRKSYSLTKHSCPFLLSKRKLSSSNIKNKQNEEFSSTYKIKNQFGFEKVQSDEKQNRGIQISYKNK